MKYWCIFATQKMVSPKILCRSRFATSKNPSTTFFGHESIKFYTRRECEGIWGISKVFRGISRYFQVFVSVWACFYVGRGLSTATTRLDTIKASLYHFMAQFVSFSTQIQYYCVHYYCDYHMKMKLEITSKTVDVKTTSTRYYFKSKNLLIWGYFVH